MIIGVNAASHVLRRQKYGGCTAGVAGLQIEERPQERWWKGAASGTRPDSENGDPSLREAARTSPGRRSVTPVNW